MRNTLLAEADAASLHALDGQALSQALAAATAGARDARISVAVRSHGGTVAASLGAPDDAAPMGCIAKLLTASLVRAAVQAGRLTFATELGELVGSADAALRSTTLRQLLEHAHGLDDSALDPPRRGARGFLDATEFLERVSALQRFAMPGDCYSYGHLGAWLAAIALERIHARRFAALARDWLEPALGAHLSVPTVLCPALGAGLALHAADLACLAAQAAAGPERWPSGTAAGTHGNVTPLPGWNPLERGVFLGWKHSGQRWFGHQSAWPSASAYVRVQPATGVAIAVLARTCSAAMIAARLFGRALPELFELRPPPESGSRCNDDDWLGRYAHAALEIRIERAEGGLWLRAEPRSPRAPPSHARLAASGRVRLASPANEHAPFVELVAAPDGLGKWLWNGRCLLRPVRA
jgi:CubicO group peptidase (beta-lactamase class C family)